MHGEYTEPIQKCAPLAHNGCGRSHANHMGVEFPILIMAAVIGCGHLADRQYLAGQEWSLDWAVVKAAAAYIGCSLAPQRCAAALRI